MTRLRPCLMPARRKSVRRCCLTVRGLMLSCRAISLLLHPCPSRRSTSSSRGVILITLRSTTFLSSFSLGRLGFSILRVRPFGICTGAAKGGSKLKGKKLRYLREDVENPEAGTRPGRGEPSRSRKTATPRATGYPGPIRGSAPERHPSALPRVQTFAVRTSFDVPDFGRCAEKILRIEPSDESGNRTRLAFFAH